jgi:hypothetical protein
MVDLRVRGGIVPAHTGRLDKVASWVFYRCDSWDA